MFLKHKRLTNVKSKLFSARTEFKLRAIHCKKLSSWGWHFKILI